MTKKNNLPVIIVVSFGIIISVAAGYIAYQFESKKLEHTFEKDAQNMISVVKQAMCINLATLESIQNYCHASGMASREKFKTFVSPFIDNIKEIKAIEWIPRVVKDEKEKFVKDAIEDGFKRFEITERGLNNKLVPVQKRAEYYPVYYVEPYIGNEDALGFDLASNPTRKKALHKSVLSGKATATGKIHLVQEKDKCAGFLIFLPVYSVSDFRGKSETWKNENIKGFALGVFKAKDLIKNSLEFLHTSGINLDLYDKNNQGTENLVYRYLEKHGAKEDIKLESLTAGDDVYQIKESFNLAEREWSILCRAGSEYLHENKTPTPWLVMLSGFIVTIFVSILEYRQVHESSRISRLVDEKTIELMLSEERLDLAVKSGELGLWDWNIQTGEVFFNDRWADIIESSKYEIEPDIKYWEKMLYDKDRSYVLKSMKRHLRGEVPVYKAEYRIITKSGNLKWILDTGKVVGWCKEGKPLRATGVQVDITNTIKVKEELRRKAQILSQMTDGVIITNLDGAVTDWNLGAEKMFGYSKEEVLGRKPSFLHYPEEAEKLTGDIINAVKECGRWKGEINFIRKDRSPGICETLVVPFLDENNNAVATIGVNRDITKRKIAEQRILHMANHDDLTDLPNRTLFIDRLSNAINGSKRRKTKAGLLFIDLDGFKHVNDNFGHEFGDMLLKEVAGRLVSCVRSSDTVGRFGGDEFVILLMDLKEDISVSNISEEILKQLSIPFEIKGKVAGIGGSIGISIYPEHGSTPEELLKIADRAMYCVKKSGKGGYRYA